MDVGAVARVLPGSFSDRNYEGTRESHSLIVGLAITVESAFAGPLSPADLTPGSPGANQRHPARRSVSNFARSRLRGELSELAVDRARDLLPVRA
jgi:hypothetical protein